MSAMRSGHSAGCVFAAADIANVMASCASSPPPTDRRRPYHAIRMDLPEVADLSWLLNVSDVSAIVTALLAS
jgi:hypothetical protein